MIKYVAFNRWHREYIINVDNNKYRVLFEKYTLPFRQYATWKKPKKPQPIWIPNSHKSSTTDFQTMLSCMENLEPVVTDLTSDELDKLLIDLL